MTRDKSVEGVIFGIIFDVGGTLIYSNDERFEAADAWSAALTLRSWGYEIDGDAFAHDIVTLRQRSPKEGADFRQVNTIKDALVEVAAAYGVYLESEEVERLERAFHASGIEGSVALPGVVEVVRTLHPHVRLAVISNVRSHHLIEGIVSKLGIRALFDPFITSAGFGYRKPSPKLFEAVLEAWQLPAENVVIIGDSLRMDIRPAEKLGIRTIWQKLDAQPDDNVQPDAVAEEPKDILEIVSSWGLP